MADKKHNKIKNTGILFESLVTQMTSDILANKKDIAHQIIQDHFRLGTELVKEYNLYQTLTKEKFSTERKSEQLLEACISARKKLNHEKLRKEKYELIKAIKESYDLKLFFANRIGNYKLLASIYNMFEHESGNSLTPAEYVRCKSCILEHISAKEKETIDTTNQVLEQYSKLDKDLRILSYRLLIEKFNQQYDHLNADQKKLLKNYINNVNTSTSLHEYLNSEQTRIDEQLNVLSSEVNDDIVKIKIQEVKKELKPISSNKVIDEEVILKFMRFYELIESIREIKEDKK